MSLEQSLDHLSHVSQFADFLQSIKDERESCIAALFDAETDKIQQISGQILAYDQILKMSNAESILFRHAEKTH
jgi:hypothetical protein